jgi:hypothetical protein
MRFSILVIIAFLISCAAPAHAKVFKCGCYDNGKGSAEKTELKSRGQITCVEKFKSFDNSLSIEESKLKIYIDGDNKIQGDKDTTIRFRPRDGKCLDSVADGQLESMAYVGPWCNNDSYKNVLLKISQDDGNYTAKFRAQVTGPKTYDGFALFSKAVDSKLYLTTLCLENK